MSARTLMERAIMHAATAGGCRHWSRLDPAAQVGLERAAEKYSTRAADFLTEAMRSPLPGIRDGEGA